MGAIGTRGNALGSPTAVGDGGIGEQHPPRAAAATKTEKIGVAVVDDEVGVRSLLEDLLDGFKEYRCAGSYESGESALVAIPASAAQLVLMDVRLPGMSGIECTRRLKQLRPDLKVIVVTGLHDHDIILNIRSIGADAYLAKPFSPVQLFALLLYCCALPKSRLTGSDSLLNSRETCAGARALTERETQFMRHLAEGLRYKEIADRMGVGYWRTHNLQRQVFRKLGATNGIEAVQRWQTSL